MKVTLKKAHTHDGKSYAAGETIDVPVHDALWLKTADLIDEGIDAIKAELKKLASKDNPAPHAEALAAAIDADKAAQAAAKTEDVAPPAPAA